MLKAVLKEFESAANPDKAEHSARFFKTAPGQYGFGDKFLGITVPELRKIAKKFFRDLNLEDTAQLLSSDYHEHRLTAAFILVYKYEKAKDQKEIYDLYLKNRRFINNWDIVDTTTPNIVGHFMLHHPAERPKLYQFAKSNDLWERRIAMLACYSFIKAKKFKEPLGIAELLVQDNHDLIHKAVGWMLREIGKLDQATEEKFLQKHYKTMPRTMLRYAIEKFDTQKKDFYMGRTK